MDARDERCANRGLARGGRARLLGNGVAHEASLAMGVCRGLRLTSTLGPCAGIGALVRGFGAVVEAERLLAGLAEEGKKIELVAVVVLAVLAQKGLVKAVFGLAHVDVACVIGLGGGRRHG